ncbi:hypothetical protein EJB05_09128, partial [Eragrostis curvula]
MKQVSDLPEVCLAYAIALASPRGACRCAGVSPAFRAAADSDHVWRRFIPEDLRPWRRSSNSDKEAYLGLCYRSVPVDGDAGCRVWLEMASGAKCYALSARRLSLPWDDGEFSWRWAPHPRTSSLDKWLQVRGGGGAGVLHVPRHLRAVPGRRAHACDALRGIPGVRHCSGGQPRPELPDQETAVTVGGREVACHAVCLRPDDADDAEPRGVGMVPQARPHC